MQGPLAQLVAERAPESLRGSAFGIFNLATDIAMLAASVVAGCYGITQGLRNVDRGWRVCRVRRLAGRVSTNSVEVVNGGKRWMSQPHQPTKPAD
jgi:hypothetical protein